MATKQKLVTLTPFYRGDTPLLVFPITVGSVPATLTGYTAILTFTTDTNPSSNADAFFHKAINTDATGTLINPQTGTSYGPNFNYQFTNEDTENFDPTVTYQWDLQINKTPADHNNFTILRGTFQPWGDVSRGLS